MKVRGQLHATAAEPQPRTPGIHCIGGRFIYIYIYIYIYTGCPRGNVPDFGRMILELKYTDITQNLYLELNGYGDNGERKVWSSCGSTYCTVLYFSTGN